MIEFLLLQTLDGRYVHVNPAAIVSLTEGIQEGAKGRLFTDKAHCLVTLTGGKFVTVVETCNSVRKRLKEE